MAISPEKRQDYHARYKQRHPDANTTLGEAEDPVIVEDINADGTTYWMQRLDDLEREIAESSSRLRTARMAFEDVVSNLATATHKVKELEERLKGRVG
jgi:hypothetical protein